MRKYVYAVAGFIATYLYTISDSDAKSLEALIVAVYFFTIADLSDIKDQIEKLKKP